MSTQYSYLTDAELAGMADCMLEAEERPRTALMDEMMRELLARVSTYTPPRSEE